MPTRLLVADDSVTIQKVVNLTFADEDVIIEAVSNGDQAVERAKSIKPDIVLADVFMPGRNGYEVCESIKNDPELSATPVVLLVGTFEPFDESEASRVKCDAFLIKPFDTNELIQVVHSLVRRSAVSSTSAAAAFAGSKSAVLEAQSPEARGLVSSRTRESFLGSNSILDLFGAKKAVAKRTRAAPERGRQAGDEVASEASRRGSRASPSGREQGPEGARIPSGGGEGLAGKAPEAPVPQVIPFPGAREAVLSPVAPSLSEESIDSIVEKVVRRMSSDVVREVAWEVVPELAEIMIRQTLEKPKKDRED